MLGAVLALGLALSPSKGTVADSISVTVDQPSVALGQIVDVTRLPEDLRHYASVLPIATFRPGQAAMTLSWQRLAQRAQAQIPALAHWLPASLDRSIVIHLTRTG